MKLASPILIALTVVALLISACTDREAESGVAPAAVSVPEISGYATDLWSGQWNGPEGTFLRLTGGEGKYEITIQNLDGPRSFQGNGAGDEIRFERDGKQESIRATDGAGTGMKWLSEKSDCLTIQVGEGYCRD